MGEPIPPSSEDPGVYQVEDVTVDLTPRHLQDLAENADGKLFIVGDNGRLKAHLKLKGLAPNLFKNAIAPDPADAPSE